MLRKSLNRAHEKISLSFRFGMNVSKLLSRTGVNLYELYSKDDNADQLEEERPYDLSAAKGRMLRVISKYRFIDWCTDDFPRKALINLIQNSSGGYSESLVEDGYGVKLSIQISDELSISHTLYDHGAGFISCKLNKEFCRNGRPVSALVSRDTFYINCTDARRLYYEPLLHVRKVTNL